MSLPHRPFNRPAASVPDLAATDGPGVLARAIAIGVVPYLPVEQTRSFATAAAALSHGSSKAHAACADAAELIVWATHQMPNDTDENAFIQMLEKVADVSDDAPQATDNDAGPARMSLSLAAGVALNALGTDAAQANATDVGTALADEGYVQAGMLAAALIAAVTGKSGTRHHFPIVEEYAQKLAEHARLCRHAVRGISTNRRRALFRFATWNAQLTREHNTLPEQRIGGVSLHVRLGVRAFDRPWLTKLLRHCVPSRPPSAGITQRFTFGVTWFEARHRGYVQTCPRHCLLNTSGTEASSRIHPDGRTCTRIGQRIVMLCEIKACGMSRKRQRIGHEVINLASQLNRARIRQLGSPDL